MIRVFSNDPAQPELKLVITGMVKEFARVEPRYVQIVGAAGASLKGTAVVTPVEKFAVTGIRVEPEQVAQAAFEEVFREGRTLYLVNIDSKENQPGRHYAMIHLATDSELRPEIAIPVMIIIR